MKSAAIRWAGLALALFALPSQAALWSLSNEVIPIGTSTRMTLSLTGNQITSGAQIDIAIPRNFSATAAGRNGGSCAVVPGSSGTLVRAIVIYPLSAPFPATPVAYCELNLTAGPRARSTRVELSAALCVDVFGNPTSCALDPGYVTVTR
jgi:hypothetical protein